MPLTSLPRAGMLWNMTKRNFQHVTIIGVGLLGGSIGLAVRRRWPDVHVAGVGRRCCSLDSARKVGAIQSSHLSLGEVVPKTDLVILATPIGAFEGVLREIAPLLSSRTLVTDVGSTKAEVVRMARKILGRSGPFVGSHPMAGSEKKGPAHARADLLDGSVCIVTPTKTTRPGRLRRIEDFWRDLGARTVRMTPAAHDRAVARISHLPHLLASALMGLPKTDDLPLASTGLRDMTRLAAADPKLWRDIVMTNRKAILSSLGAMTRRLDKLQTLIDRADGPGLERFLKNAQRRRDETLGE